jgi:hypothetical protein
MINPSLAGTSSLVLAIMLCTIVSTARAQTDWEEKTAVQALIGATHFNNLVLDVSYSTDGSIEAGTEYTWMPLIGISGQLPYMQAETFSAGLEGSALGGWRSRRVTVAGRNGALFVRFYNSLLLLDLSMGLYLSAGLGSAARVYAGAGPLLMFGISDIDTREVSTQGPAHNYRHDRSSAFGVGLYGRGGIEFRLADRSLMGVGVRAFWTELDFDNVRDETRVRGVQFMITYTVGM